MTRTPEQVAADAALTGAIEGAIGAYRDDAEPYVTTEYLVVAAQTRFGDDGGPVTAISVIFRDSDVPLHRALGLVEYAAARLRATICDDGED